MIKKYLKSLLVVATLVIGVSFSAAPSVAAQDASYSCGTYGGGNYSQTNCTADSGGGSSSTGSNSASSSVKPPNTGFAALTQPANLLALVVSLLLIALGIGLIIRLYRRRTQ